MDTLLKKFKDIKNELFFISCGPVSEIIINKLYTNNPYNSYVDVGSSIDELKKRIAIIKNYYSISL